MRKSLPPRSCRRLLRLLNVCAVLFFCGAFNFALAAAGPTILTDATSTRAIALEAVTFRHEPFSLLMPVPFSPDTRNRIVFFVMNLDLLAGESANALTADAEDASHHHYAFKVENVTPVPGYEWTSQVTLRLSDDIGDVGDVLLRINLHGMSSNRVRVGIGHVGGGPLDDATAIITPAPFPAPSATPVPTPNPFTGPASTADTVRFLEQATFGPTSVEVARVQGMGFRAYLNEQFSDAMSSYPTLTLMNVDSSQGCPTGSAATCLRDNYSMHPLQIKFFQNALNTQTSSDQLRQRVSFALHQILVISGRDITQPSWMSPYLQTIDRNSFGNFRQLLYEMTLNPGMGAYLDMAGNNKSNPNENYAREILQLFSVGLDQLNPDGTPKLDAQGNRIPTYDQTTITNFARVFTGWNISAVAGQQGVSDYITPMAVSRETNHDTAQKVLLNGAVLPANQTSTQDLNAAIDNIFNHPNVGPFIGKQLIQQLVTSNPSPAYVERVAAVFNNNCNGLYPDSPCSGARGDLKSVVRAILLDPEARGDVKTDPAYGRLREPAQFITNILRVCSASSDGYLYPNSSTLDQDIFRPPTVFSYYPADYLVPGTDLSGPQFGILSTSTSLKRANFVNTILYTGIPVSANAPTGTQVNLSAFQALAGNPAALVGELDRLMMHGTMSPSMKNAIVTAVTAIPVSSTITNAESLRRAQQAIYLVASSSQYQIAR
jgi:uncharacterized protein (DUF1800 family)